MKSNDAFPALMRRISSACILYSLIYMIMSAEKTDMRLFPLTLLVYAPGIYLLDLLFLKKERSVRSLVIFNALLGALYYASVFIIDGLLPFMGMTLILCVCAFVTFRGCTDAVRPPELHEMVQSLDLASLMLAVFISYAVISGTDAAVMLPAAVGFAAAVAGIAAKRVESRLRPLHLLLLCCVPALICAAAIFAARGAGNAVREGLLAVWDLICRVGAFIGDVLHRIFELLASLIRDSGPIELEPAVAPMPGGEFIMEETPGIGPAVIGAVCLLLLAFALFLILRCSGRKKVGGRSKTVSRKLRVRRSVSLADALRRLLERLRLQVKKRAFLRKNRDTALGLYYTAERICRHTPLQKSRGETPREFVSRLAGSIPDGDALRLLLPEIDAALFSRRPERRTLIEAPQLRRLMRKYKTRQLLGRRTAAR